MGCEKVKSNKKGCSQDKNSYQEQINNSIFIHGPIDLLFFYALFYLILLEISRFVPGLTALSEKGMNLPQVGGNVARGGYMRFPSSRLLHPFPQAIDGAKACKVNGCCATATPNKHMIDYGLIRIPGQKENDSPYDDKEHAETHQKKRSLRFHGLSSSVRRQGFAWCFDSQIWIRIFHYSIP
jgi:hypothetical protein